MPKKSSRKQEVEIKKEKKRRKIVLWWWFGGGLATLSLLITAIVVNPFANQTSSSVSSTSTSLASSSSSAQVVNRVELTAIEVEKLPTKLNYQATDVISTLGGSLRLVYSDYTTRIVPMNDSMIDISRLNLTRLGSTNVTLRYEEQGIVKFVNYQINVIPFVVNPTKVSIDIVSSDILFGQRVNLNYIIEPLNASFNNVVWTSSNPSIASIDQDGVLTTLREGEVIITVSVDGNLSATTRIKVITPPQPPMVETSSPEEPRGAEWIPIANGHDLMMIGVEGVSYTFAADFPASSVEFGGANLTPGSSGKYYLLNDIDLSNFDNSQYAWSGLVAPNSILPIGYSYHEDANIFISGFDNQFSGEFDGNGKKISGMLIDFNGENAEFSYLGLFSVINDAVIYDLQIELAIIDGRGNDLTNVGLLAGYSVDSDIENIDVLESIIYSDNNSTGLNNAGGLIGFALGTSIIDSNVELDLFGWNDLGGLVGFGENLVVDGAIVNVNIEGNIDVGGIVGNAAFSTISNVVVNSDIDGEDNVGGIIGYAADSNFSNLNVSANVIGDDDIGGAFGEIMRSTVSNVNALKNIDLNLGSVIGDEDIGGLVGRSERSSITNSTSYFDIIGDDEVGGLVGSANRTTIADSHSHGNVSGEIKFEIYDDGDINFDGIYIIDAIAISSINNLGGLVGELERNSTIINSTATGNVVGININQEFINTLTNTLNNFPNGPIELDNQILIDFSDINKLGGLVGDVDASTNESQIKIINSQSTGEVVGMKISSVLNNLFTYNSVTHRFLIYTTPGSSAFYSIGGFIGEIATIEDFPIHISESYSFGDVYGLKFDDDANMHASHQLVVQGIVDVGGFIGLVADNSIIDNSSSLGNVYGFYANESSGRLLIEYVRNIGGFIGASFKYVGEESRIINASNSGDVFGIRLGSTSNDNNQIVGVENIGGLIGYSIIENNIPGLDYYDFINNSSNVGDVYGIYLDDYSGLIEATGYDRGVGVGGLIGSTNSIQMTNVTNGVQDVTSNKVVGLRIDNYNSINGILSGFNKVGGLIGSSQYSKIDYSINYSDVIATEINNINNRQYFNSNRVGGLIGHSRGDYISNSSSTGDVIGLLNASSPFTLETAIDEVNLGDSHSKYVGGLIGETSFTSIIESYSSGEVSGLYAVGGLVGSAYGVTVRDSYSTSKVTATSSVGGLVGYSDFGEYNKVYYLNQESGDGVYNIKGLNDVGGLIGQGMHPIVENAYAKFNKIIATYDVGGLSGRIWNDYHNGFSPISYTSVNLFDYVYAIGNIELNTVPTIPTFKAVGGLIGEVEAVVTNAFVNVVISPSTFEGLAIGAVFGIVADPLTSQEVDHISPITQLGKIYYDSNVNLKVGSNELSVENGYDDIPVQITNNIISDDIVDLLNLSFLTTVGNWTGEAWDVATTPNNNFMWNLLDYSLTLSEQPFFTITATLGSETIQIYDLNPIIVRESNEDNSLFPNLVFTLTLNTSYYSYYVPEDPVAFNAPNTTIGFSRQIPTGMTIVHSINSNEMTITLSASEALDTDLIDQFSGYINVFTTKIIPGNPLGSPDRLEYGVINLPTIMFVFVEAEITEQ